jgi:hypothetical protein
LLLVVFGHLAETSPLKVEVELARILLHTRLLLGLDGFLVASLDWLAPFLNNLFVLDGLI